MNLKTEELKELNKLLKDKSLDLPSFRREVTPGGSNYKWLQKNILVRNSNLDPRLKELLRL